MNLPETVNILGITYKVIEVDVVNKNEPRFGELNFATSEIRIDQELPDEKKIQVLMHEILHGIFDGLGMEELCKDERSVQSIATALCCIFGASNITTMLDKEDKIVTEYYADGALIGTVSQGVQ